MEDIRWNTWRSQWSQSTKWTCKALQTTYQINNLLKHMTRTMQDKRGKKQCKDKPKGSPRYIVFIA
eukprot:9795731-Lingulodinium_polyedra.AAC.1